MKILDFVDWEEVQILFIVKSILNLAYQPLDSRRKKKAKFSVKRVTKASIGSY